MTLENESAPSGPVDATNRRFFRLLEDGGPLFIVWCAISLFMLGYFLLAAGIELGTGAPYMHEIIASDSPLEVMAQRRFNPYAYLVYPVMIVMLALHYASLKVIVHFDRRGEEVDLAEARRLISERFGFTALVSFIYIVLCGLGGACCLIPGLIAAYLVVFAPYLASSKQMSVARTLITSSDWAKRHWVLVTLMIGIGIVATIGMGAVQFFAVSAFTSIFGLQGIAIGHLALWVFASVAGYFMWLYTGAIYATIERFEAGP